MNIFSAKLISVMDLISSKTPTEIFNFGSHDHPAVDSVRNGYKKAVTQFGKGDQLGIPTTLKVGKELVPFGFSDRYTFTQWVLQELHRNLNRHVNYEESTLSMEVIPTKTGGNIRITAKSNQPIDKLDSYLSGKMATVGVYPEGSSGFVSEFSHIFLWSMKEIANTNKGVSFSIENAGETSRRQFSRETKGENGIDQQKGNFSQTKIVVEIEMKRLSEWETLNYMFPTDAIEIMMDLVRFYGGLEVKTPNIEEYRSYVSSEALRITAKHMAEEGIQ